MNNEITKTELRDQLSGREGYLYRMKSSGDFANVEIVVDAEVGGHGCLFGIEMPQISMDGGCWSGSPCNCSWDDFKIVLNKILEDYHCKDRVLSKEDIKEKLFNK
jgi:hypothetical protein